MQPAHAGSVNAICSQPQAAMIQFEVITHIDAPIQRVFDLSRDIGFHVRSLAHTGERAVAGRTEGLIELSESVTWQARHLGVRQRMICKVVAFERPTYFRDEMQRGAFKAFGHDHRFGPLDGKTVMTDTVQFTAPLGPLGWIAERVVLHRYLKRLISDRADAIRREVEHVSASR